MPHRLNRNGMITEFEYFYQQMSYHTTYLSHNDQEELKSKLRRVCENYIKIRIPYKYKTVIQNLSQNRNIVLLNQDKGQGIVILDRAKYNEKCMTLIMYERSYKTNRNKITNHTQDLKNNKYLNEEDYKRIYPKSSAPVLFYGNAKLHKLKENDTVKNLPLRPIISDVGTTTCKTTKYLATFLWPLTLSEYNIENSYEFVKSIKNTKIPNGYKMISFDVKNLFTNLPLDKSVKIILRKIYQGRMLNTSISQKEMKKLLYLCTKHVHSSYGGRIYIQVDGVAMGSPLGLVLTNIFMTELEIAMIPSLGNYLQNWKRFVDDTFAFVLPDKIG